MGKRSRNDRSPDNQDEGRLEDRIKRLEKELEHHRKSSRSKKRKHSRHRRGRSRSSNDESRCSQSREHRRSQRNDLSKYRRSVHSMSPSPSRNRHSDGIDESRDEDRDEVIHSVHEVDSDEADIHIADSTESLNLGQSLAGAGQADETGERVEAIDSSKNSQSTAIIVEKNKETAVGSGDTQSVNAEEQLTAEILQAIGDRLMPERVLAPAVHKDLVVRVEEILKKGLPSEERKKLIKKFPPPENCVFLDPPKLNLEVKASLLEPSVKRDARITEKQERITAGVSGLLNLTSLVFKLEAEEKLQMLSILSGLLRIFADLQHEESLIRRSLILKNINASLRETLNSTSADEWLFGKNLDERVKAAKTLATSSQNLKPKAQQSYIASGFSKNTKGPPRRPSYNFKRQTNATPSGQRSSTRVQKPQINRRPTQKSSFPKRRD